MLQTALQKTWAHARLLWCLIPAILAVPAHADDASARFYAGAWNPISTAVQALGSLDIGPRLVRWQYCSANYDTLRADPGTLSLDNGAVCGLNDHSRTRIRYLYVQRLADQCNMEVSFFSEQADIPGRPAAVGVFRRADCGN